MSTARPCRTHRSRSITPDPRFCARTLGGFIQGARNIDDRPLAEIAPLAALTVDEWLAIEAGQAPDTWEQVLLIAQVLRRGPMWLSYLAKLYKGAKKQ